MYFLVFAAFAIVLSTPDGPPWPTLDNPWATYGLVGGQVLASAAVGAFFTRAVRGKLDRDPGWLPGAQRLFGQGSLAVRAVLAAGLASSIYLTDWVARVQARVSAWPVIHGLDEMLVLTPFFLAILAGWIALYPADRAIRRVLFERQLQMGIPPHPVWRLRGYLTFLFRQHVLIIAVPMIPIVVANDYVTAHAAAIRRLLRVPWGDDAMRVAAAGVVFFFAPVMLRYIWHTRVLPPGELRAKLEALCERIGLTYRRILVWESDGMVVNAAVMGLLSPVRYVLLSDGLLEMMDDRKIEAVFGHEAGHVKHRHIQFFMLFAVLSMFMVGGLMELVMAAARHWPQYFPRRHDLNEYLKVAAVVLIVVIWAIGFGYVSRRFEWQADLFGARSVTPPAGECDRPCLLHGTAPIEVPAGARPVCATAAILFADALHRIADLNGIPLEARSWRHSSIANRMRLLRAYTYAPLAADRLDRLVVIIKAVLVVGTLIGLAGAVWIYGVR
ncbi:MAG: M48 family metalloprotease [Phycisphaerae bacterium]|jgi:STE24 endopeptidase